MRTLITLAMVTALTAAACGASDDGPRPAGARQDVAQTTATLNWHAQSGKEGSVSGTSATLTTDADGAKVSVNASELNAAHAYTLWWVLIDNPKACAAHPEPCTPPDVLDNPATDAQVVYGTGKVVEAAAAVFDAKIDAGTLPGGWFEGRTFDNPKTAEVHIVLNDHGPVLQDFMPDMIRTYRGGCADEGLPAAFPPTAIADGMPGPNTCRLWQTAVFIQG